MLQTESLNQDLTLNTLKGLYRDKGLSVNEKNLNFNTKFGKYNLLAKLIPDTNNNYSGRY